MGLLSLLPDFSDEGSIPQGERKFNLIRSLLPGVIQAGHNQTESRRIFRAAGLRFADARFNSIYNQVKESESRFSVLRSLTSDSAIRRETLTQATRPLTGDIRFVADYDVTDETLSANIRGSFSIDVSSQFFGQTDPEVIAGSVNEVEEAIIQAIADKYGIDADIIQNIRIKYGFYNPED